MKKRKILVLFPFLGLLLSGCTIQEALGNVKDWTTGHILDPIKNLINGGEKEEQPSGDEGGEDQPTEVTIKRIRVESCPTEVAVNYVYKTSEVAIKVFYSDGTEEVVEPETVRCDTSTPGDSTLYVTYKGFESDYPVRVLSEEEVVHAEDMTVDKLFVNLHVGDTHQIVATFTPDNTTNQTCSYAVDNEQLASVSSTGLVTALTAGVANVTVTSNDNENLKKTVQFTIAEAPASLPGATTLGYTRLEKDVALLNGEKVNIAGAVGSDYYALPNYSDGNNIKGKAVSEVNGALDIAQADEFTIIANADETVSFLEANGNYLAATGTSGNQLKEVETIETRSKFKVSVNEEGYATVQAPGVTRGIMALNPNNGNPLFNCYSSADGYSPIVIYHNGVGQQGGPVEGIQFTSASYEVEKGSTVNVLANVLPVTAENKGVSYELKNLEPAGCMEINGNVVTGIEIGTGVVVAKSDENPEITAEVAISVIEPVVPDHAGTLEDPYSPEDAKIVIDKGMEATGKYVAGIVSKIVTPYDDGYKNISFNISSDGSEDGFQLQGFRTKGTEEYPIASNDDVQVGDHVILYGNLTKYGSTYEFAAGNQLVFRSREAVLVESIALDPAQAEMTVGLADLTLTASVLPANATEKSLTWSSSDETVATVANGVVHAVAEGDAVITAAATDGSGVEGTASIHVSVPQKEVVGVVVSTMPKVIYNEGEFLDLTGMELTITYNDQSVDEHVTAGYVSSIAADHALTSEDTELVITYAGVEAEHITLTITPKPQPVHAGTAEDPYTIKDCEIVYANANLDTGKDIGAEVYVAGTIVADPAPAIASGRAKVYISDNSSENTLYIHQANNIGGSNNLTLADVPAGSAIVAKGTLKNYNGAMQMCYVKDVANCEFISIEKPFIAPATVEITSGSELGVGSNMNLAATVGPEGAAQDVEWTIVTGGEYATLSDGVLTGVAAGDVTVRATAVGYENVYAEKTIAVSSSVAPTEQVVYTLDGTVTGGSSGYAEASEITQSGVVWSVEGNTTMNPWRIGGKNLSGVDRVAKSTQAVTSDDLSKVSVTTGTKTLSAVNSITISVGSTEGASDLGSQTFTTDLVSTTLEFERPSDKDWSNAFITVVFNVNAAGSNQYIQLIAINLYAVK